MTLDGDDYLARVQACLDARRNPLDDPAVVAFLDAHPEHLDTFARLCSDVRGLELVTAAPRRRWLPMAMASALAAGALFALLPLPSAPSPGRVLDAHFEELRPRSHLVATFVVRETLIASPTSRLETWQTRSAPR